jgi:putative transposase
MKYHSEDHHKYSLKAHLIFVIKYRKKLIQGNLKIKLKEILFKQQTSKFTIEIMETDLDHIHILIDYSPTISVSSIVKKLKQMSTFYIWKYYNLEKYFWKEKTFWSDGYFACSAGDASTEIIKKYIESQG